MYSMAAPRGHRFGGDWTTAKLAVLANYLAAYTTALKDRPISVLTSDTQVTGERQQP